MNIQEYDRQTRMKVYERAGGICEICHRPGEIDDPLEDHHIISRGRWLTRWVLWNRLLIHHSHHIDTGFVRNWLREHKPRVWRWIERSEQYLNSGRYRERNMNPERIRARLAHHSFSDGGIKAA